MTQEDSRMSQNEGERRGTKGVVCIFSIEDMRRLGSAVGPSILAGHKEK